jgi:hypothetical protein
MLKRDAADRPQVSLGTWCVPFQIAFTPSAEADLAHFKAVDQRVIVAAIRVHLATDATSESRRRKKAKAL